MPEPNYKQIEKQIADCIINGDQSKDCSLFINGPANGTKVANYLRNKGYIVTTIPYGDDIKVVVYRK